MHASCVNPASTTVAAMSSARSPRTALRLIAALVLPLIAFLLVRQAIGNATGALAVSEAIPTMWLLAVVVWRRRIDLIALFSVGVFAVALGLTILFGGSSLPLELRRSVFPGVVGLACLASIAIHRPLLATAWAKRAQSSQLAAAEPPKLDTPGARRAIIFLTAIIGVTFLGDAASQIVLALTVSTSTFAEVARFASWSIFATGLTVCVLYIRHARSTIRSGRHLEPNASHPPSGG